MNLHSKDVYDQVTEMIAAMQTVQVKVLKVLNSRLDNLKEKLYEAAILDARKKADVLAKVTSQQVDTPISITEQHFDISEPESYDYYYYTDGTQGVFTLRLILNVTFKVK